MFVAVISSSGLCISEGLTERNCREEEEYFGEFVRGEEKKSRIQFKPDKINSSSVRSTIYTCVRIVGDKNRSAKRTK